MTKIYIYLTCVAIIIACVLIYGIKPLSPKPEVIGDNIDAQAEPTPTPIPTPTPYPGPYPDMFAEFNGYKEYPDEKRVYLTFDDGPSQNTLKVLEVLRDFDVKATFFVVGDSSEKREIMKRIVDEGHGIAVHTYSHDYGLIYKSVEAFLEDFSKQYYAIVEAAGVRPTVFRFPGGSNNGYNKNVRAEIIDEMSKRGFIFYDWDVASDDAAGSNNNPATQLNKLSVMINKTNSLITLQHDAPAQINTAKVTADYIPKLITAGYTFHKLDNTVMPTQFVKPIQFEPTPDMTPEEAAPSSQPDN